jgi:hypothetical protein
MATQDPGADTLEATPGKIVVDARGAVTVAMHLLKGSCREKPTMQPHAADPERVRKILTRAGTEAID